MLPSPTVQPFPGSSPSRDVPNPHPYAIKTSSSAVLTRSNSTGHRYHSNHHYTPISPSKNSVGTKHSRYVPSHKHTRSLPFVIGDPTTIPPPVPMPPSSMLPARLANKGHIKGDLGVISEGERALQTPPLTVRVKRSETLSSVFPNKTDTENSIQDLPNNPKTWTPTQLSVYLSSALRMKGGAKLPAPVARDIGLFVMKEHLNGRAFLRMNKEDYDVLGINQLWKDALFDASRALRQNLVQGQIMGFESCPPQLSPSTDDELRHVPEDDDSGSDQPPAYGSSDISHRRISRSIPPQWEEDKQRMNKTSFRAGRVRSMIETYERSFSESSASGSDCEEPGDILTNDDARQLVCEPEDEGDFASGEDNTSDDEGNAAVVSGTGSIEAESDPLSAKEPVEYQAVFREHVDEPTSQPSVEALLHQAEGNGLLSDRFHSWGAKAWEDEVNDRPGIHVTAKRIPLDAQTISQKSRPTGVTDTTESPGTSGPPKGLTELFSQLTIEETTPLKSTRDVAVSAEDQTEVVDRGAPGPAVSEVLHAFQKRLEILENKLDEMERYDADKELQQARNEIEQLHERVITERVVPEKKEDVDAVADLHLPPSGGILHGAEPNKGQQVTRNYIAADPTISELPRYMMLVSLGIVAITARVVLQRVIGCRRKI